MKAEVWLVHCVGYKLFMMSITAGRRRTNSAAPSGMVMLKANQWMVDKRRALVERFCSATVMCTIKFAAFSRRYLATAILSRRG